MRGRAPLPPVRPFSCARRSELWEEKGSHQALRSVLCLSRHSICLDIPLFLQWVSCRESVKSLPVKCAFEVWLYNGENHFLSLPFHSFHSAAVGKFFFYKQVHPFFSILKCLD